MSQFPIYDSLCQEINNPSIDLLEFSEHDKEFLLEKVKDLDSNGKEIFYALIHKDEIIFGKTEFSFKQMKNCVRIDYDKLFNRTRHLLVAFLRRHEAKLADHI